VHSVQIKENLPLHDVELSLISRAKVPRFDLDTNCYGELDSGPQARRLKSTSDSKTGPVQKVEPYITCTPKEEHLKDLGWNLIHVAIEDTTQIAYMEVLVRMPSKLEPGKRP